GSYSPTGQPLSFLVDWGDGATDTAALASHLYGPPATYTVTLTVTDDLGATATQMRAVVWNGPPECQAANAGPPLPYPDDPQPDAAPGLSPPSAVPLWAVPTCGDVKVRFDGGASSDLDGVVSAWAWDFGDGTTADGRVADHTYAATGTYPVRLTVRDDSGASHSRLDRLVLSACVPLALSVQSAMVAAGQPATACATTTGGSAPATFAFGPLPAGARSEGGCVHWTPSAGDAGSHCIPVTAASGIETATACLSIQVSAPPYATPLPDDPTVPLQGVLPPAASRPDATETGPAPATPKDPSGVAVAEPAAWWPFALLAVPAAVFAAWLVWRRRKA
ncbi:MAG: PKD domain-containing protein, partial [Thermoplasmatota archaeon]|nr:PKD domain-containing protein [Halobacteriales archaeon]